MIRLALVLALLSPALLWFSAVGNPLAYLDPSVPDGQLLYVLSKLAGLYAVTLLMLQLSLTVLHGTRVGLSSVRWPTRAHARLGVAVLLASALHVVTFVAAASLRSGHFATHLLLPRWQTGFYDRMVSIGVLTLALLLVAAAIGAFARRHPAGRSGRRLHRVTMLSLVPLVLVHSYAIGSETGTLPMMAFYAFAGAVMAVSVVRAASGAFR